MLTYRVVDGQESHRLMLSMLPMIKIKGVIAPRDMMLLLLVTGPCDTCAFHMISSIEL